MAQVPLGRLKAGSLVESLLALTLLAGALSSGVWIHARVLTSDKALERVQAWQCTETLLEGPDALLKDEIEVDGFRIRVDRTTVAPDVERIQLVCSFGGREVLTRRTLRTRS